MLTQLLHESGLQELRDLESKEGKSIEEMLFEKGKLWSK
jgi:hypothetical protein